MDPKGQTFQDLYTSQLAPLADMTHMVHIPLVSPTLEKLVNDVGVFLPVPFERTLTVLARKGVGSFQLLELDIV